MTSHIHRHQILDIIGRLDAIENDERSVLDDDGVAALIELSDMRHIIRQALLEVTNLRSDCEDLYKRTQNILRHLEVKPDHGEYKFWCEQAEFAGLLR